MLAPESCNAVGFEHTTESHPSDLQKVTKDREVSASEDEHDQGGEGDPSCSLVLPLRMVSGIHTEELHTDAQQGVEEGVVVCKLLARHNQRYGRIRHTCQWSVVGSGVGRRLTRACKITEFGCGGTSLVLDGCCNRT